MISYGFLVEDYDWRYLYRRQTSIDRNSESLCIHFLGDKERRREKRLGKFSVKL